MSGEWEAIESDENSLLDVFSLGATKVMTNTYKVENKETGEVKTVVAYDRDELGEKIANGEFEKE